MSPFRLIRDVLARDLDRPIEEVIKLSQTEEAVVYTELTEYVLTDNLRRYYTDLLRAITESAFNPTEGTAVWVSGFFGSGKSAFVKNLGYLLANPMVRGKPAADLFIQRVREAAPGDATLPDLIRNLTQRLAFEVFMFDISATRAVQRETERLAEIMYRVLLQQLDYAYRRYDLAELEIELESEGRLAEFVKTIAALWREGGGATPQEIAILPTTLEGRVAPEDYAIWKTVRLGAQGVNRASAALYRLDPTTYPNPDSWAKAIRARPVDVTVHLLIERTFNLMARRRPGKAAFFILDEVGQYVARSSDKILDLQGVVREFGAEGRNRAARGEAPAPVWLVVTSQEKLNEVVDAIGDKRIELAKLQDSFRHRIDLGPQDIQEVAARRVLVKKPEAVPVLEALFERHRGTLNSHASLEQSSRFRPIEQDDFVKAYPYLPHLIGLSIDIMSALRLQSGGVRHLGGSNRTIIKQAHEMLINEHTRLADAPLGTLVTLDKVYELVGHNISSEKQRDIGEIDNAFGSGSWEAKVARVLALIEQVQHLPRTARNIAALLYERLGSDMPIGNVEAALQHLEEKRFVRQAEGGWKLLSVAEKTWEDERRAFRSKLAEEINLLRQALERLWDDPALQSIPYQHFRNFAFQVTFQGHPVTRKGDFPLHIIMADDDDDLAERIAASRRDTRATAHQAEVHWLFAPSPRLTNALQELARSTYMISKYDQVMAQQRVSEEQIANLENEKRNRRRWESEVERYLQEDLLRGSGVFRGQVRGAASFHARTWKELTRKVLHWVVPELYDHLEEGSISLPPKAASKVLSAGGLEHLPPVFYDSEKALGLVVEGSDGYSFNADAPTARAILSYMHSEREYGHSVTGKKLEEHFSKPPFGWRLELVQAVMALLLRLGRVEVVAQGRRLRQASDPRVRQIFEGTRDFRAATFRLRQQMDIRMLVRAARTFRAISGEDINPEEPAIYDTARQWSEAMRQDVRVVYTRAQDAGMKALLPSIKAFFEHLEALAEGDSEEVVRILAEEGQDLQNALQGYEQVSPLLEDTTLNRIRRAQHVLQQFWPDIAELVADEKMAARVARAREALNTPDLAVRLGEVIAAADEVANAYQRIYADLHLRRGDAYQRALEQVQAWPEWEQVNLAEREQIIQPLTQRACAAMDYDEAEGICRHCRARIPAMRSDLRAVKGYLEETHAALRERIPLEMEPSSPVHLRLRDVAPLSVIRTPDDVETFLAALRAALLEHIEQGEEVEIE